MRTTETKLAEDSSAEGQRAPASAEVITVRAPAEVMTRQRLPYFLGISATTAGARGLSMHLVSIPPGAASEPHIHRGYETAIYMLQGRVETRYGAGLARSVISEPGDFLFIPPDVPHQSVNLSTTEPARAVIARNDANEHEQVVLYAPDAGTPAD
jgi:Predicted mannose-6-phosphate isomerase